jgi:hypothetical protein
MSTGTHETLWRCRECGKWSHAKRDPIAHKRWVSVDDPATNADGGTYYGQGWFVWCGPFDRWEARHNDPSPRAAIENFGEPVNRLERDCALNVDNGPGVF